MRTNREHVTMDGNEAKLLDRYEAQFGETPPIAFLDPQTSKRLMRDAIRNNRPFNEKDLELIRAIVVEKWKSSAWPRR
jgi:hypothetical protein